MRHSLSAADRRRTSIYVRCTPVRGKGRGVVAVRDIPAYTMVAPYPGYLLSNAEYTRRLDAHLTTPTYVVAFYKATPSGVLNTKYVLDPGGPDGRLLPEFTGAVAPLINEPGPRDAPNVMWVWNLPKSRMEVWTTRLVTAGEEVVMCYGTGGGYRRGYATSCVTRPCVEPELHVVTKPRMRPVPYSSVGMQGLQKALRQVA